MTVALITGITGQDGSYLAELLLEKGYRVHGYSRGRPSASSPTPQGPLGSSSHLHGQLTMHTFPPADAQAWDELLERLKPHEFYHLAADSFVPNGWTDPVGNVESNLSLTIRILDAIRRHSPETKFLNACSREVFGNTDQAFASEDTPMNPFTPYGINKAASRWLSGSYRDKYRLFIANAILFNHESHRRPAGFVTRKITRGVAEIALGLSDRIELGNVAARRDWGYAGDFVDAMWRMLQLDTSHDFVLGTGVTHSIAQFAEMAFSVVGLSWQAHVATAPALHRKQDTSSLAADCTRAKQLLDWQATRALPDLVAEMVEHDLEGLRRQVDRSAA